MSHTFICTVCENRIKEHASYVTCKCFSKDVPMIEDTTKLYDKSFLCKYFDHIRNRDKKICSNKQAYKYYFDAIKAAAKLAMNKGKVMRPYRCDICNKYHLTSEVSKYYDPVSEYKQRVRKNKIYD